MPQRSPEIKVGLVGAGAWSAEVAAALSKMRGIQIVAISNRTVEKAHALATRFRVPHVFREYQELCTLPELDAVLVLTHESAHLEPTLLALAAGKSVFVEKPMADSSEAARQMAAHARTSVGSLMPGHVLRFETRCRTAKERLTSAGAVRSIRCFQHRPKRCYSAYCQPHIAFSLMIHHLDLCQWFAQAPVVAVRSRERFHLGPDYPSMLWVTLEFANGCIATLESGWVFETDSPSFEEDGIDIITEKQRIRLRYPSDGCEIRHTAGVDRVDRAYLDALHFELEHWAFCLTAGVRSDVITAEEGAEAVSLAERVVAAARKDHFPPESKSA